MKICWIKSKFKNILILSLLLLAVYNKGYFVLEETQEKINESTPPYSGVISYIINLDRSRDRYDYVAPQVNLLGYDLVRISGVDGSSLSENEIHQKTDFESYKTYLGHYPKRGMIGCNLSHFKAWETFLKSNAEFALIFEDDVSFDHKVLRNTVESLKQYADLWDIVTFEISHRGLPLTLKRLDEVNSNLSLYLTEITHAGSYIINRTAAKKLMVKFLPIKMPIDHYFTRAWEFDLKFVGIEPRIVFQAYGDSNINATTRYNIENKNQNFIDYVQKGIFKLQSYIVRFFYNLKIYVQYIMAL